MSVTQSFLRCGWAYNKKALYRSESSTDGKPGYKQKFSFSTCLLLLVTLNTCPQNSGPAAKTPTLDQLADATKIYFRDSTEIPLQQEVTLKALDSSGRTRKSAKASVEWLFQGYSRRRKENRDSLNVTFWQILWGFGVVKAAANSDTVWLLGLITMFSDQSAKSDAGARYSFRVKERMAPGPLTAQLTPIAPCPQFKMERRPAYYLFDGICGTTEFQLKEDLSLESFTYEAGGLPAQVKIEPFGRTTLRRYYVEAEFHKVMLPGDSQPLVIPKSVTTTLETAKGNIVITSVYNPKPASIIH